MSARSSWNQRNTGGHRPPLQLSCAFLWLKKRLECGLEFASGVFIACFPRYSHAGPKRLLSLVLQPELLIELAELIIGCHVVRIAFSDSFKFSQSFVILPELDVFQRQRVSREGIVRVVLKKAL